MMTSVLACILSYNRKELLARCLEAVFGQERPPDGVLVLDNGSSDGTPELLAALGYLKDPRFRLIRLEQNVGASGGLDRLFRAGYAAGFGWLWVMDDDVIPEPDALAELANAYERHFEHPSDVGYLVSAAYAPDGSANNVPAVDERRESRRCAEWGRFLADGMVKIRNSALSSALIPRSTLESDGGPCPDFHIWGEDTDYTLRITQRRPAYLAARSRVLHVRAVPGDLDIFAEDDAARIDRFYYLYRNTTYLRLRFWPSHGAVLFLGKAGLHTLQLLFSGRRGLRRAGVVVRGTVAGLFFRPRHRPLRPFDEPEKSSLAAARVGRA